MNAGKLSKYCYIQSLVIIPDSFGQEIEEYRDGIPCWASIDPLKVSVNDSKYSSFTDATHKMKIRYAMDISNKNRVRYGNRVFEILGVLNTEEKNKELILITKELINAGS